MWFLCGWFHWFCFSLVRLSSNVSVSAKLWSHHYSSLLHWSLFLNLHWLYKYFYSTVLQNSPLCSHSASANEVHAEPSQLPFNREAAKSGRYCQWNQEILYPEDVKAEKNQAFILKMESTHGKDTSSTTKTLLLAFHLSLQEKYAPAVTLISISSCSRCQALSTGVFSVISEFPQLGTWAE